MSPPSLSLWTTFTSRNDVQKIVFFPSGYASILWSACRNLEYRSEYNFGTQRLKLFAYPCNVGMPLHSVRSMTRSRVQLPTYLPQTALVSPSSKVKSIASRAVAPLPTIRSARGILRKFGEPSIRLRDEAAG